MLETTLEWYHNRRSRIPSWDEFEEHLRKVFISQTNTAERFRRMNERVQQWNESTLTYLHAKVPLCGQANMEFCDTRKPLLIGLRSRDFCTMLMGRLHYGESDLMHEVQDVINVLDQCVREIQRGKP